MVKKANTKHDDMLHPTVPIDDARRNTENPSWARKAIAIGALVVTATVGGSMLANNPSTDVLRKDASGSEEAKSIEKTLSERIMSGEAIVENSIVVLGKGATFRSEPARITGPDDKFTREENQVFIVGDGESVVIDRPVVITDEDDERWAGVHLKVGQVNTEDGTEQKATFAWVNLSAIEKQAQQNDNPNALFEEMAYSYTDVQDMGTAYQSVTENGTLTGFVNPASGTELSSAFIMPANEAIDFAKSQVA